MGPFRGELSQERTQEKSRSEERLGEGLLSPYYLEPVTWAVETLVVSISSPLKAVAAR